MKLMGEGCCIEIDILGYEYAQATLSEDRNWLSCKVVFEYADCTFCFNCLLQTYDLIEWMHVLKDESRIAVLRFPEVECSISMIKENGIIKQVESLYNQKLRGGGISQKTSFAAQMLVKDVCVELEEMLLVYPVV